jgi:hypothetical protein
MSILSVLHDVKQQSGAIGLNGWQNVSDNIAPDLQTRSPVPGADPDCPASPPKSSLSDGVHNLVGQNSPSHDLMIHSISILNASKKKEKTVAMLTIYWVELSQTTLVSFSSHVSLFCCAFAETKAVPVETVPVSPVSKSLIA